MIGNKTISKQYYGNNAYSPSYLRRTYNTSTLPKHNLSKETIRKSSIRKMIVLSSMSSIIICSNNYEMNRTKNESLLEEQHIINTATLSIQDASIIEHIWNKIKEWYMTLKQALIILTRSTEITALCTPLSILAPLSYIENHYSSSSILQNLCWKYAISIIEYLGPSYIKLAQWASTRRDLFPPIVCNRLSRLQCNTRVHKWKYTHDSLTNSFGDYTQKGLLLTPQSPIIGSGAVAQVYKGYLKNYGPVAIKVLHPNVSSQIEKDVYFLQSIANVVQSYLVPNEMKPCMDLPIIVENMAQVLRSQVDLRIEAENLLQFQNNFSSQDTNVMIQFPSPVKEWVSSSVLVEDLIVDAQPISSFIDCDDNVSKKKLAQPLFHAFLKMLFIDNFFHCDLHPGNILISSSKSKNHNTRNQYNLFSDKIANDTISSTTNITFLDAGLTHQLTKKDFQNLKDLFLAIVLNDGRTAGELMISRERSKNKHSIKDIQQFSQGIQEIVSDFHEQKLHNGSSSLTLSSIQIGSLLTRVLDLCRLYKVEMDPVMVNVVVSVIVLEGLGRSLDGDLDLMDCALPFLIEATASS